MHKSRPSVRFKTGRYAWLTPSSLLLQILQETAGQKMVPYLYQITKKQGRYMCHLYDTPQRMIASHEYMYRQSRQLYDRLYDQRRK